MGSNDNNRVAPSTNYNGHTPPIPSNATVDHRLIYSHSDKPYLTMRPHSPYPTSNFRDSTDSPNGWEYQHIKFWPNLNPNWFFVPTERTELCTREKLIELLSVDELREVNEALRGKNKDATADNAPDSNIEQSAAFADDPSAGFAINDPDPVDFAALASSKEHEKFLYFNVSTYDASIIGTGFVIDTTSGSTKILGCYKTFAASDPLRVQSYRTEISKLKFDVAERQIDIDRVEAEAAASSAAGGLSRAQKIKCTMIRKQIYPVNMKIRRLNGLLLDRRPHAIAFHRPLIFEVSSLMNGEGLQKFGKTYGQMMGEFETVMGEVFDGEEDVPGFVERERRGVRGQEQERDDKD